MLSFPRSTHTALHPVGVVEALDRDRDDAILKYYIVSGNEENKFTINHVTGEIMVTGDLDREEKDNYRLHVEARDETVAQYKDTALVCNKFWWKRFSSSSSLILLINTSPWKSNGQGVPDTGMFMENF